MQLKFIKDVICPDCSCSVIIRESSMRHSDLNSPQNFEEREFNCGIKLQWNPKYQKLDIASECKNNPKYREKILKRNEAMKKVAEFIKNLDVDENYKNKLASGILF